MGNKTGEDDWLTFLDICFSCYDILLTHLFIRLRRLKTRSIFGIDSNANDTHNTG